MINREVEPENKPKIKRKVKPKIDIKDIPDLGATIIGEGKRGADNNKVAIYNPEKAGYRPFVIQTIISLLLTTLVVWYLAPMKKDFTILSDKITVDTAAAIAATKSSGVALENSISTKFSTIDASINSRIAGIDSKVSATESRVNTFDARVAALSGLETTVNTKLAEMNTKLSAVEALSTKLTALDTKLTALETKVNAVATTTVGGSVVSAGAIKAEIKQYGDILLVSGLANGTDSTLNSMVKLTLTNTGTVDIEDIMLTLSFEANTYMMNKANSSHVPPILSVAMGPDSYALSGGTSWTNVFGNPTGFCFRTPAPGIKLKAGEVKKWYITLTATYMGKTPSFDITFEPLIEVDL